jgi:hypothetical protein
MALTTIAAVRELEALAGEEATYTDAMITAGIAYATEVIEDYTGAVFETASTTVTVRGSGDVLVYTGIHRLQSVTAATVSGTAVADVTEWYVNSDGTVVRDDGGYFPVTRYENVSLTLSHGYTTVPAQIAYAAQALTQWYVMRLASATPDNATQAITEFGTLNLAQAGGRSDRPTALPEVNAILNRYRDRAPSIA